MNRKAYKKLSFEKWKEYLQLEVDEDGITKSYEIFPPDRDHANFQLKFILSRCLENGIFTTNRDIRIISILEGELYASGSEDNGGILFYNIIDFPSMEKVDEYLLKIYNFHMTSKD